MYCDIFLKKCIEQHFKVEIIILLKRKRMHKEVKTFTMGHPVCKHKVMI